MSGSGSLSPAATPASDPAVGNPVLLEAIDRGRRLGQHGSILAAIGLLLAARYASDSSTTGALALIAAGLVLFTVAARISQRWSVDYQGHRIVLENNPFRGERLSVDGVVVAKGKLGVTNQLRAIIITPAGPEEIVARTDAGLLQFRCVIRVVRGGVSAASNDALLAEVRRRGLV
jgi:hypothetical protein